MSPNAEGVWRGAEGAKSFNAARVWGTAVSSPSGSGRSPDAKRHLVHFWSENALP